MPGIHPSPIVLGDWWRGVGGSRGGINVSILDWPLKSIFWPPSLVARQLGSVLLFKHLLGWKRFPRWLFTHSLSSLPVAAGAVGMGCIGFPAHPAWEVTSACNLRCIHCHASSSTPSKDEFTTDEAKRFIDSLREVQEFRMLVYTGGEPLMRHDIFELLNHSKSVGFTNVIATNGTLIDEEVAFRLREAGVVGAAVSLDSPRPEAHNFIRKNNNAYALALRGMDALRKAGILLQVNATAMEYNFDDFDELLTLADKYGSGIMLAYQLVPVGRGSGIRGATLSKEQNKRLLEFLARRQIGISTIVEPVAAPQYWPYLMKNKGKVGGSWLSLAKEVFHGCAAGRGFVYIKANGEVWPCPFVDIVAGNVKERPFIKIWEESEVFINLREREHTLKGGCGRCDFRSICGGCRGKAKAYYGDYLEEDPSCFLRDGDEKEVYV